MADKIDIYSLSRSHPFYRPLPKQHSIRHHIPSSHPFLIPHRPTLPSYPPHTIPTHLLADKNLSAHSPTGLSQVTQVVGRAYYRPQAGLNEVASIIAVQAGQLQPIVGDQVLLSHPRQGVVFLWHQATGPNQGSRRRVYSVVSCANLAPSRKPRQMNRFLTTIRCLPSRHVTTLCLRNGFCPLRRLRQDHWRLSAAQLQGERSVQLTG